MPGYAVLSEELRWPLVIGGTLAAILTWLGAQEFAGNAGTLLPIAALGLAGGGYVVWAAAMRQRWALLVMLIIGPTLLSITFRKRQIGDPTLDFQVAMKAVVWAAMAAISIVNIGCLRRFLSDRVMVAFGCYCILILLSTLYSPAPLITGLAAVAVASYFVMACLIVTEIDESTIMIALFWAFTVVCIIHLASAFLLPGVAYGQNDVTAFAQLHPSALPEPDRLQGLTGQPNNLGRYASIAFYVVLAIACRGYLRPLFWVPSGLLSVGLVVATQSRGTLIGMAVGLIMLIRRPYLYIVLAIGAAIGVGIFVSGLIPTLLAAVGRNGDANEAVDMSGRAELWVFTWGLIKLHPLIGYGFNSFEVYAGRLWTGDVDAGVAAHNNYLSVLYSNGVIGMIPFALGFGILLYRWLVTPDTPRDFFVITTLVCGYAEMDALSTFSFVPTLNMFVVVAIDAWRRMPSTYPEPSGGEEMVLPQTA